MIDITFCIVCAVCGFVWVNILTAEDAIFGGLHVLNKYIPYKVLKPFLHCSVCCSGQIAFWSFPLFSDYSVVMHIINVLMSIFFAYVLSKADALIDRLINRM